MLTAEQMRILLNDRILTTVAKNIDVHRVTLSRFVKGEDMNYQNMKKLSDYLERK